METIRAMMLPPLLTCCFSILLLSQSQLTTAIAAASETVKVSTTPIFPEIPQGQARKDFQVLLRLEAPAAAAAHRAPIDVVAMLDVSGSMNDPAPAPPAVEKRRLSRLDVLKAAAKFMVAKLHDVDRLSVVAFNDRPVGELSSGGLLYMSGDGRRNAVNVVDKLEARGGTALLPALEEAVKILDGRPGDGRSRQAFIILLTDGGDATSGHAWSSRRWEFIHGALCKYPIHAIALGTAHDPEPLHYLAQESHGTYSFLDDDNSDKLPGALAVCLAGITTVAAVDTRVVLKVADDDVRIDRVDAGGHESVVGCGGAACEVAVGVLYAGEAKHFVVHLNVPAAASVVKDGSYYCDGVLAAGCNDRRRHEQQHLLAVGYSYRPHPAAPAITTKTHGVFVHRSPELGARHALLLPSPVVLHHIVRFELVELIASLVDGELADAVKGGAHVDAGEVLQVRWEEFRACHQFWGGLDLAGLEREVDAMATSLRVSRSAAYVYAWVSSHRMQRAASLGSPEKAAAEFLTPAMRLLMEEAQRLLLHAGTPPAGENVVHQHHADCGGGDLEMIDRRLELWSKVRHDVQHLVSFRPASASAVAEAEGVEHEHLAAVFHEASLEAIDRAMHRDIYLAAVFASKQRRCHWGVGK